MIEIIKEIIKLITTFINGIFYLEIDLTETVDVYIGVLVIAFLFIVLSIYFIFKAIGLVGGGD